MSKKNSNLHEAKRVKNDEFYTKFEDVNAELDNYREHFKGKVVYCNCDSAKSAFYQYFRIRFEFLGLKKLIATHYDETGGAYKLVYEGGLGKYHPDMGEENYWTSKTNLTGDGDFRSEECVSILDECDVVVTNPPFSLFREFISEVVSAGKEFLVIGSMNAITYKEVFPLIQCGKIWLGVNYVKTFTQPDHTEKKFGNICWFTNLSHRKRAEELISFKDFSEENFPKFDNYKVVNIDKVKDIPVEHKGAMGVPITFLFKHNPDQFEILDANDFIEEGKANKKPHGLIKDKEGSVSGVIKYARIVIKRK